MEFKTLIVNRDPLTGARKDSKTKGDAYASQKWICNVIWTCGGHCPVRLSAGD